MPEPTATPEAARHALIIGAGPGLGAAIARRFGREGFSVTVAGRDQERLDRLAAQLRQATGSDVDTAVLDASDAAGFKSSLEALAERISPAVVVYNAALLTGDDALTSSLDHLTQAYTIDVLGAISTAQVFAPAMRLRGRGTILATGGGLALAPNPEFATMSIGKAALRAAVALLHDELKADGVHVAGVTVAGNIEADTPFAPDLIAEAYWNLHVEPADTWSVETVFDGK